MNKSDRTERYCFHFFIFYGSHLVLTLDCSAEKCMVEKCFLRMFLNIFLMF